MKTILIQILLLSICFTSCEKPQETPGEPSVSGNKGTVFIEDNSYELTKVDLIRYDADSSRMATSWIMHWYSEDLELYYAPNQEYVDSAVGIGHYISVYFSSPGIIDSLPEGNYSDFGNNIEGFRFYVDWDFQNNTVSDLYSITDSLSYTFDQINLKGLSFSFNAIEYQGVSISGNFVGDYRHIDVVN